MAGMHLIALSEEQRGDLTIALGMATSLCVSERYYHFAMAFMELANHLHEGDPEWKPLNTRSLQELEAKWAATQPVH